MNSWVSISVGLVKENKGWWDDEFRQAVKHRKKACRAHKFYKKLSEKFPGEISQETVRENGKNISI